jgi:hypothetical protein
MKAPAREEQRHSEINFFKEPSPLPPLSIKNNDGAKDLPILGGGGVFVIRTLKSERPRSTTYQTLKHSTFKFIMGRSYEGVCMLSVPRPHPKKEETWKGGWGLVHVLTDQSRDRTHKIQI